MARVFSRFWSTYVGGADDSLERIENAIYSARVNAYTADQAVSDWVAMWANVLDCWRAGLDFATEMPKVIDFYIGTDDVQSDPVTLKLPKVVNAVATSTLHHRQAGNDPIAAASVSAVLSPGPPATLTVQLINLVDLVQGLYSGPLILDQTDVVLILVRVR